MTYDGGADTRIETPLSAVHKPQLTLSKPASVISAPGSVTERSFTICQTAVDAYIKRYIVDYWIRLFWSMSKRNQDK